MSRFKSPSVEGDGGEISCLLQGGLGNQLFILAAALEQSVRLSVPLKIDVSLYDKNYGRTQEVSQLDINSKISFQSKTWDSHKLSEKRRRRLYPTFVEKSFRYDDSIYKIGVGTKLVGYFQSYKYFPSVGKVIGSALLAIDHSKNDKRVIENLGSDDFIAVHVRRGDYSTQSSTQSFHGLTTAKYFRNSLELCLRLSELRKVLVFCDSPSLAISDLPQDLGFDYSVVPTTISDFATLELMSRAKTLIISNSSFSWWAGWLGSSLPNRDSFVIAPRPWFAADVNTDDLLPANWISLGN
jgi:hypothetical protein